MGIANVVQTVGYAEGDKPPHTRIWFSPWMRCQGHIEAPGFIWHLDGRKITMTARKDTNRHKAGDVRVWILTDEYDAQGYRLGVWPD